LISDLILGITIQFCENLLDPSIIKLSELLLDRSNNEIQHWPAYTESRSNCQANQVKDKNRRHDENEPFDRSPQMDAQILEMITERHPRVGEHVFGIGLFFEFEHGLAKDIGRFFRWGETLSFNLIRQRECSQVCGQ
jgi:hypothetical protein